MTHPDPGRVEVRLLRRLPADPAGLRGRTAHPRRTGAHRHTSSKRPATIVGGPYDVSLVEGSITTAATSERIHEIREQSTVLVTIGACATAGGIQALRNFADVDEFASVVYAKPDTSTRWPRPHRPAAHVTVDYELQGCPIDRGQLLDTLRRAAGRTQTAPARQDSVHRVQTARPDLCRCRRGHPVPWPGDPRRLRGAVPVLPPRLLRLLRPCRDTQHRSAPESCLGRDGHVDGQEVGDRVCGRPVAVSHGSREVLNQGAVCAELRQPSRHRVGDPVGGHVNGTSVVEAVCELVCRTGQLSTLPHAG